MKKSQINKKLFIKQKVFVCLSVEIYILNPNKGNFLSIIMYVGSNPSSDLLYSKNIFFLFSLFYKLFQKYIE